MLNGRLSRQERQWVHDGPGRQIGGPIGKGGTSMPAAGRLCAVLRNPTLPMPHPVMLRQSMRGAAESAGDFVAVRHYDLTDRTTIRPV